MQDSEIGAGSPSLYPALEVYEAHQDIYDKSRALQAIAQEKPDELQYYLSLRVAGAAKFAPWHFMAGPFLATMPGGLYLHNPKPNPGPRNPAWDWQLHVVKLFYKTEAEANRAFESIMRSNDKLKKIAPAIKDYEITDPQGNPIQNPSATDAQLAQNTAWKMTIRTPFAVPWGKLPCHAPNIKTRTDNTSREHTRRICTHTRSCMTSRASRHVEQAPAPTCELARQRICIPHHVYKSTITDAFTLTTIDRNPPIDHGGRHASVKKDQNAEVSEPPLCPAPLRSRVASAYPSALCTPDHTPRVTGLEICHTVRHTLRRVPSLL
jgi:hypothetical protein